MIQRVVVAGGGTGGHLFPGIAVVEELRRRWPAIEVTFVGTAKGIEARVLPPRGEKLELIDVAPLKGRTAAELMRSLAMLPGALSQARAVIKRAKPDLAIGVGGYASGPMLLAAAMAGIPTAILEQNAYVGLTNRVLAKIAGRAYVAFDEAADQIGSKARKLGNPVRRAFVDSARTAAADPEGFEARSRRLFVLGGSQGARVLNEVVPEALAQADLRGCRVVHQSGSAMKEKVAARYAALGIDAEVVEFIDDMAKAYASASLVIARAGATSLAEMCAIGRPAILVPFPHAADDHQARNADALERAGAAISIRERDLNPERLATEVSALLADAPRRKQMAGAARTHGRPDAAAAIVDDLCAWLGADGARPAETPERDRNDGGPARFATVDFRAIRGEITISRRSTRPPPPAYLQVVAPAPLFD